MTAIRRPPVAFVALVLALTAAATSDAQIPDDPILVLEVWSELDPLLADARPVPREVAVERLVEEARLTLSGMIYGYRFRYVPSDPTRGVADEFDLEPYAEIARGDARLTVFQTWVADDRLYARVFYRVGPDQAGWYRGWRSAATGIAEGVGVASFFGGPESKPLAIRDALRSAVRALARERTPNRPREVSGAVVIAEAPTVGVREGNYEARLSALVQIDSIEQYRTF